MSFSFYLLLATVVLAVFLSVNSAESNAPRNLLGFSAMRVVSPSMQSEIPQGSLVITQYTLPALLKVGDVITYFRLDGSTITHRIITIYEDHEGSGQRGFETMGIENGKPDPQIVSADNVIGKVIWSNLVIGQIFTFVRAHLLSLAILGVLALLLLSALRLVKDSSVGDPTLTGESLSSALHNGNRPHSGHTNTSLSKGGMTMPNVRATVNDSS